MMASGAAATSYVAAPRLSIWQAERRRIRLRGQEGNHRRPRCPGATREGATVATG